MIRITAAALLAAAFSLAAPAAHAATIEFDELTGVLVFRGGDELNRVSVEGLVDQTYGAMLQFNDSAGVPTYPEASCLEDQGSVYCVYTPEFGFRFEGGGNDDWVRMSKPFDSGHSTGAVPATFVGGPGNDHLEDEGSATTVRRTFDGGAGNDILIGHDGDDLLLGGDGDDNLQGGAGPDELRGGAGNDELLGDGFQAPAADIIDGGQGFDTGDSWNVPASSNPAVSITQDGVGGDGRPGENDNVTSVEKFSFAAYGTIEGTDGADNILTYAFEGPSTIRGLGGDDTIESRDESEDIDGGAGNDTIRAGVGHDKVTGGSGADNVIADASGCSESGTSCVIYGNDQVFVRDGEVDSVDCGPGLDSVQADHNDVIAPNCENVDRTAAPDGGGGGGDGGGGGGGGGTNGGVTTTPDAQLGFSLLSKRSLRAVLRSGVRFSLTCPSACEVTAELRHKGSKIGKGRRTLIQAGKATVAVRLTRAGKARLRRLRRAPVSLRVSVKHQSGQIATFSKAITLTR